MSNARTAAVALYTLALAYPASANWHSIAVALFEALPKGKAAAPGEAPAWWADYALPKVYTLDSMDVLFADGTTTRVNVANGKNKPPRIASACRAAIGFYRAKHGHAVAVPAFGSLQVQGGQAYDAAECSRLTDEIRAIPGTVRGRAVTDVRIAWMETEVARRKAGLQRALYERNAPRHERASSADSRAWIASVRAGEKELRMLRESYAAQRGEAAPVAAIAPVVAPVAAPVALPAPVAALDVETVLEALAAAYGECAELELAGTFEAESGLIPADAAPAIVLHSVAVELETVASEIVQACEPAPVPADEPWAPTAETHPVIAYCLSHKARETLFARVQDGTFPDDAGSARAGAWRLTLADAEDLRDVGSIRFAGMPRKPYTRRAAAPVASFVRLPAGAPFMAANPPRPVTLHAPSA